MRNQPCALLLILKTSKAHSQIAEWSSDSLFMGFRSPKQGSIISPEPYFKTHLQINSRTQCSFLLLKWLHGVRKCEFWGYFKIIKSIHKPYTDATTFQMPLSSGTGQLAGLPTRTHSPTASDASLPAWQIPLPQGTA